jgi:hypothetical protein
MSFETRVHPENKDMVEESKERNVTWYSALVQLLVMRYSLMSMMDGNKDVRRERVSDEENELMTTAKGKQITRFVLSAQMSHTVTRLRLALFSFPELLFLTLDRAPLVAKDCCGPVVARSRLLCRPFLLLQCMLRLSLYLCRKTRAHLCICKQSSV